MRDFSSCDRLVTSALCLELSLDFVFLSFFSARFRVCLPLRYPYWKPLTPTGVQSEELFEKTIL